MAVMDLIGTLEVNSVAVTTGTVTPANLVTSMPFVRVMRIGGGDTRFDDTAHIDIDAFGATREAAYGLAESCRQLLLGFPYVTAAGVIDSVVTTAGPHEVPWGDIGVRRLTASYAISSRRSI